MATRNGVLAQLTELSMLKNIKDFQNSPFPSVSVGVIYSDLSSTETQTEMGQFPRK